MPRVPSGLLTTTFRTPVIGLTGTVPVIVATSITLVSASWIGAAPPRGSSRVTIAPSMKLTVRNDFGVIYNPAASVVSTMPGGSGPVRPFYETTGTAVDIRFRRVVDVRGMPGASSDFGYVYEVAPP